MEPVNLPKKIAIVFCLCLLFGTAGTLCAASETGSLQGPETEKAAESETTPEKIERYHEKVGSVITSSASWADSFFGTETYTAEVNKTTVRMRLETFFEEGEDVDTRLRFRLQLKLPKTQKRFRFTIASDTDELERTDDLEESTVPRDLDDTDDNITAALEYFFLDRNGHNIKYSAGALFRDGSPVLYAGGRYRYLLQLEHWAVRFVERVRWYTDTGWESRTELDFERSLSETLFFRSTPSLKWEQEKNGVRYSWTNALYQSLSVVSALEYQFNNHFDSELAGQLKETNVRVRYRRQVWRKWLIFEVAPQLAWYENRNFETVPGILFRLEIWMGQFEKIRL